MASAEVLPEKLSTLYESAVVFGRASVVTEPAERQRAFELLAERFCGGLTPEAERAGEQEVVVLARQRVGVGHPADRTDG